MRFWHPPSLPHPGLASSLDPCRTFGCHHAPINNLGFAICESSIRPHSYGCGCGDIPWSCKVAHNKRWWLYYGKDVREDGKARKRDGAKGKVATRCTRLPNSVHISESVMEFTGQCCQYGRWIVPLSSWPCLRQETLITCMCLKHHRSK